jgi:tetratricopeptide (TPR) repeat protein
MRYARYVAAALLGLVWLIACTSPEERFADHVARGEAYTADGELKKALLEYNSALKIRPDDAELNERVGDVLRAQRSPQDAAFFYREAHRLEPERTSAMLKEARLLLKDDPRRARQLIERAIETNPNDPFALRTRSELELSQGRMEKALEAAEKAAELAPEEPSGWMQVGSVHLARLIRERAAKRTSAPEEFEAAIAAFRRADETAGGDARARLEIARTLAVSRGRRSETIAAYREAVDFARGNADPAMQVAVAESAAGYGRAAGNPDLETWALRQLVGASKGRLDAWQRLAQLAEDAEAADAVYREMLAEQPDNPLAHIQYANALIRSDRRDEAIAHLEEALEDGVQSPLMWEQLLRLRMRLGQLADARATLVRMADAFPEDPITRRAKARLLLMTGQVEEAAEILRQLMLEEESVDGQSLLARAESRAGNQRRAVAAIDRAIALSRPVQIRLLEQKANIHMDGEEWPEVVQALNEIVARGTPLSPSKRVLRGVALYEIGRAKLGRQALLNALEEDPLPEAAIEYARREGERDPEGARRYLEASVERYPTHRGLLSELTAWDLRQGRADEALARLDKTIENHQVRPPVLLLRADLLARAGRYDAAEADALRAFEAAPTSPEALDLLFRIYVGQGKAEEATKAFREAEEAGVLHAGARVLLGRLSAYLGDTDGARAMFEKVLEENPDLSSAQGDLAFLLAQQGEDLDRALDLARRARHNAERDPRAAHRLGYVYLRSGRNEAAVAELFRAARLADESVEPGLKSPIYYHLGLALRAMDRDQEAVAAFSTALKLDDDFPEADDARRQIDGIRQGDAGSNAS